MAKVEDAAASTVAYSAWPFRLSTRDREDARVLSSAIPFVRSLTPPRSFSVSADFSSGRDVEIELND